MEKKDFDKCQVCGVDLPVDEVDSPIYCDKCLGEMQEKNEDPNQLATEKELEETLDKE